MDCPEKSGMGVKVGALDENKARVGAEEDTSELLAPERSSDESNEPVTPDVSNDSYFTAVFAAAAAFL